GNGSGTSGDIRYCIEQADNPANAGSTIVFDNTVFKPTNSNTIALHNGELQISQNTTIIGLDAAHLTISGSDGLGRSNRVFDITSSAAIVSISGMTIANGNAEVFYTSIAGNQGGDIFNSGNLTLSNCIVSNGLSVGIVGGPDGRGGAIFNATGNGGKGAILTL